MAKYDADATFVKEYVPELRDVPAEEIVDWPTLSRVERETLAPEYPHPIVDRNEGYERAQRVFEEAREAVKPIRLRSATESFSGIPENTALMSSVTIADVEAAAARLEPAAIVQRTPVERSRSLSERCGADVRLKMEHLQRTGSFKTRGAYNAISRAVEQAAERADESELDRVVAASAGNHAQGSPWRRRAPGSTRRS